MCLACGAGLHRTERFLCLGCLHSLPKTGFHRDADNPVMQTFRGRLPVVWAGSFLYFRKETRVQNLVHQLKYKGQKELGVYLGKLYGSELRQSTVLPPPDYVVPVPMHPRKEKKRGYNQAALFAAGLAESTGAILDTATLIKTTATESQTRKGRLSRWENVKEVFSLNDADHFAGKHILLADDVITTGATLEACGQMLLKIPGVKISVAAIATAGIC